MASKREPQKHTRKEELTEPEYCPFCKEGTLTASPSGVNILCMKCGRIVTREVIARAK
jgi:hypothetical protein